MPRAASPRRCRWTPRSRRCSWTTCCRTAGAWCAARCRCAVHATRPTSASIWTAAASPSVITAPTGSAQKANCRGIAAAVRSMSSRKGSRPACRSTTCARNCAARWNGCSSMPMPAARSASSPCAAMRRNRARAGRARWRHCNSIRNAAPAGPCSNPRAGRGMAATARSRRPACAAAMAATCARTRTGRAADWICKATSCHWRWSRPTCRNAAMVGHGSSLAKPTSPRSCSQPAMRGAARRRWSRRAAASATASARAASWSAIAT